MLYFISFTLQVLEHSGLFNNIVGELVPFHVPIPIDINFIEQKCQVPHERNFPIGDVILPKLKMLLGNHNKLLQPQLIVPLAEFLLQ